MGRSARLAPIDVVVSPKSLAADFNSELSTWENQEAISYQINVTTSDSTGQFLLQTSLDGDNWVDIGACGTVAAADDTIVVEYIQQGSYKTRVRYAANVPGTGTCEILVSAKAVGA